MISKNFKIVFSARALSDIKEAREWYNLQQKGLGKRLVADVKLAVLSIKRNPFHASIKFENIRTTACSIFPYSLHYEIDDENELVRIVSIFHFSRKPYWLSNDE